MVRVLFFENLTSSFGLLNYSVSLKLTLPLVTNQSVLFHKLIAALHHTQFFRPNNMQIKFIIPQAEQVDARSPLATSSLVSGLRPSFSLPLSQSTYGKSKVLCEKKTAPKNT